MPWRRRWQPIPVFLSGKTTEGPGGLQSMEVPKSQTQLSIHTHTHTQAKTSTSIHEVWFVDKRTQSAKVISPSPKAQEPGVVLFKGKKKCCPISSREQIHVSSTLLFYAGPQQVSVHPHWEGNLLYRLPIQVLVSSRSILISSVQFSSVTQSCPTLCDPMNCSTPGLPVHHQLPESTPNPCPLCRWCHPTIPSSIIPFSSLGSNLHGQIKFYRISGSQGALEASQQSVGIQEIAGQISEGSNLCRIMSRVGFPFIAAGSSCVQWFHRNSYWAEKRTPGKVVLEAKRSEFCLNAMVNFMLLDWAERCPD